MKKKVTVNAFVAVFVSAACIFLSVKNCELCFKVISNATVISACAVLPVGFGNFEKGEESEESTEGKETSDEQTTRDTSKEQETTTVKKEESTSDDGFASTDEDIKKLMEAYEKKADKDKKGGAISEQTYKSSGVTDSYGNVRIKNINDTSVSIKKLLSEKADLSIKDKSKPSVLIFHTHTTECYQILDRDFYAKGFSSRSESSEENMIRVGDAICKQLEEAGYTVIHDTNIYDKKYNGAYSRSREQVEKYLEKYPTIQIVLDIHRDAIQLSNGTKIKPVATVNGKKCAQLMIISGCQESGNGITGFPDWKYNLTFGVQLQNELETLFPGITRPLYFCPRKYNMDTSHCSLLIEVGSDANTLDEAVYAGKCLGVSLAQLMQKYTK